jgi:hypothetical protein
MHGYEDDEMMMEEDMMAEPAPIGGLQSLVNSSQAFEMGNLTAEDVFAMFGGDPTEAAMEEMGMAEGMDPSMGMAGGGGMTGGMGAAPPMDSASMKDQAGRDAVEMFLAERAQARRQASESFQNAALQMNKKFSR